MLAAAAIDAKAGCYFAQRPDTFDLILYTFNDGVIRIIPITLCFTRPTNIGKLGYML
jgi:hypothetical protein